MAVLFWVLVAFATVSCLFMAWSLGANSNSPPFAPAIGANAVSTMRAAFLVGILAAAGAIAQGGSISKTVGAELIDGVLITPLAASTGLLVAAAFMMFGVYSGYPVPAAFATTGAMVGVGLSLGGDPAFDTYRRVGTFWLLVPPISGGLAFLTATILRRDDVPDTVGIPLLAATVSGILAHVRLGVVPHPTRAEGTVAEAVSLALGQPAVFGIEIVTIIVTLCFAAVGFGVIRRRTRASVETGIRTFLLVLGSVVAFSSGGSQVGLATGPLENLYGIELGLPGIVLLTIGATGILAGAWMCAPVFFRQLPVSTHNSDLADPSRRSSPVLFCWAIVTALRDRTSISVTASSIILKSVTLQNHENFR